MKTKGWQKVFSFTLVQYIKTKSFIIGTIIMCLITALLVGGINIIPKLISDEEEILGGILGGNNGTNTLTAVYIIDDAGILTDEDITMLPEMGVCYKETDKDISQMIDILKVTEAEEALVTIAPIAYEEVVQGYQVKAFYSPASDKDSVSMTTDTVSELVKYRNSLNSGVTPENYVQSQRYISTSMIKAGSDEWNVFESAMNYFIPIVVSLILFIMIFAYGQTVAQAIATEKTSRVMELLLTSVRPLAVVIGKVLAMGVVSLGQFVLLGIVGSTTFIATAPFGIGGEVINIMQNAELQVGENAEIVEAINNTIGNFNAFHLLLILVIFILGFLFFSLLAALVGASISRMEDLQQAMQPYSLIGVLGFYLAYFPIIFNVESIDTGAATSNPIQIFSYYFPVSSPFSLPSALLLGTLSIPQSIIAVLILAAFVVLIAIVVSKVYEAIILHNGNRIKLGDIIKMALRK